MIKTVYKIFDDNLEVPVTNRWSKIKDITVNPPLFHTYYSIEDANRAVSNYYKMTHIEYDSLVIIPMQTLVREERDNTN